MLLRLAYLGLASAFAMLRLLPMSDRGKDVEILALRHQMAVLERQLNGQGVRFDAGDREFLVALFQGLPPGVLRRVRLVVRPGTVLRWGPRPGRPPPRRPVPAETRGPTAYCALHPCSGPAPARENPA
ncbi:hypothetical protein [Streptomyces mirabilis]|uniref:hypothetical protein n=1 Tax=Streptomyces mirabilis TaxID=68239 RepID=UPI003F4CBF88